jgi:hypothetical protein
MADRKTEPLSVEQWFAAYLDFSREDQERAWLMLRELKDLPPWREVNALIERFRVAKIMEMQNSARLLEQVAKLKQRVIGRKPEYERDLKIVRLKDEEKWTFPEIGAHFEIDSDAAERAYWRMKELEAEGW